MVRVLKYYKTSGTFTRNKYNTMAIIDLSKKMDIRAVGDSKDNWEKAKGQEFYKSPSGKTISLAELLPNGDWWIIKTWRANNITELN